MADFIFADKYRLEKGVTRDFYETFLKGLVHKHNNLMGVIQGFSSLILYDDGISNEVRDSAQQMQDSAKIASELNREVLIAAGCSHFEEGQFSLTDMMPFLQGKAEEACNGPGVALQVSPIESLPPVRGDGGKFTQIFEHLIRNAAEAAASTSGGSVAIDAFPPGQASPGGTVDLFIRNTSEELDEEAICNAFVPFETTKGSDHFGLGLTTAAVLAGEMDMRLGLRHADATTTAWVAMPVA
ncbi:MAG: HAMP domain-containing sensor histidine kinase, partial [Verrucomicrobiota bacterium]